ncbi:MAG: polyprenyl synthetase family protein [Clostridia bacterium]|nr:polyprenyl synthetase family protein [Clostridia bacterium]
MSFKEKFKLWVDVVNDALDSFVPEKDTPEKTIYSAMRYSLMAGGKRLRPILAFAVCEILDGDRDEVLPYACAIEMIHTYSLIHDDMPCMDNDDYRRGRLTNHKVYGEGVAVLAGDALLNYAFELMLNYTMQNDNNLKGKVRAMQIIAKASGSSGMIGGQIVDLESEGKKISETTMNYIHKCKTGALIKAPVLAAAAICNASENELERLEEFAEKIGLAFQIKDDILDVEGSLEVMGKPTGSDAVNEKSTFVTLYGIEESKRMLCEITEQAINSLSIFGEKRDFLVQLAKYLVERDN